jgi:hypothetical protein
MNATKDFDITEWEEHSARMMLEMSALQRVLKDLDCVPREVI